MLRKKKEKCSRENSHRKSKCKGEDSLKRSEPTAHQTAPHPLTALAEAAVASSNCQLCQQISKQLDRIRRRALDLSNKEAAPSTQQIW